MRGKPKNPPSNELACWLDEAMERRGLHSIHLLADMAGVSQARITQIRNGDQPSRDMVERLARALAPEDADEHTARALLDAGLMAAGFIPLGEPLSEHPAISYLRRQPDPVKDRALRIMEAALPPAEAESQGAGQQKAAQKAALVTRADNLTHDLRGGRPRLARTPAVVWALGRDGRFLMSEGNGLPAEGLSPGQVVGLRIEDVYKDAPDFLEKVRLVLASDSPLEWSTEVRGRRYLCKTEPLRNEGGEKIGIVGTSLEVLTDAGDEQARGRASA